MPRRINKSTTNSVNRVRPYNHIGRAIGQVRISVTTLRGVRDTLKPMEKPNKTKDSPKPEQMSTELDQEVTMEGKQVTFDNALKEGPNSFNRSPIGL